MVEQAVTPLSICSQDPRVTSGLVSAAVCAGARVFFDEKFDGNGRTCGSCHPVANNFTIDGAFVASLPTSDALFVAQNQPSTLGALEDTAALHSNEALIRENVDGFVENRFVARSVPHTLSLATSLTRDPADLTSASVVQRTGWSGDGSPGDGSLRNFIDGAIKQHYPRDLSRTPNTSFRFATSTEKDQVLAFQLALGRLSDINLTQVTLTDANASLGKAQFMDPLIGRCNECHSNAGANSAVSGKNRNFNSGTNRLPPDFGFAPLPGGGGVLLDGGFGGQLSPSPDFSTGLQGPPTAPIFDGFGDGTFNVPPLIEAADTGPFFHSHASGVSADPTASIESAVTFYSSPNFLTSPAAHDLDIKFGQPVNIPNTTAETIARFLRVLNASFNLAIAKQRMDAAHLLNVNYWAYRDDIQINLLKLASEEIDDAIRVLQHAAGGGPLHAAQQTSLASARGLLDQAVNTTNPAVRKSKTESALSLVVAAKAAFGTNMNFQLGTGNLMF